MDTKESGSEPGSKSLCHDNTTSTCAVTERPTMGVSVPARTGTGTTPTTTLSTASHTIRVPTTWEWRDARSGECSCAECQQVRSQAAGLAPTCPSQSTVAPTNGGGDQEDCEESGRGGQRGNERGASSTDTTMGRSQENGHNCHIVPAFGDITIHEHNERTGSDAGCTVGTCVLSSPSGSETAINKRGTEAGEKGGTRPRTRNDAVPPPESTGRFVQSRVPEDKTRQLDIKVGKRVHFDEEPEKERKEAGTSPGTSPESNRTAERRHRTAENLQSIPEESDGATGQRLPAPLPRKQSIQAGKRRPQEAAARMPEAERDANAEALSPEARPPMRCWYCFQLGHGVQECDVLNEVCLGRPPRRCYVCGERDHHLTHCPDLERARESSSLFRMPRRNPFYFPASRRGASRGRSNRGQRRARLQAEHEVKRDEEAPVTQEDGQRPL